MKITDISLPEVYKESADFRFFCRWIEFALTKIQYNTENLPDIYDPLRCPSELLWMLADTMGYRYDDRLPTAFNRLVLLYFMSMIRNKGSKDGLTLAAETNLAQFNILEYGKENDILYNRLEDTSIPVNSVYVTPHPEQGYIDVIYFSTDTPIDVCTEYVRPLGMYLFQYAGVRVDARTKIAIDSRLTNMNDVGVSIGPTHVGHYSRRDYASMQKMYDEEDHIINTEDTRQGVYYRNKDFEQTPNPDIDPGYRALYSLQLCNNEHIVNSLLKDKIFGLGYTPTDVETYDGPSILPPEADFPKTWNLRYDKTLEESISPDVYTMDNDRSVPYTNGRPMVNPVMTVVGEAIAITDDNTKYTKQDDQGNLIVVDVRDT